MLSRVNSFIMQRLVGPSDAERLISQLRVFPIEEVK
jgi:hypothetical protein